MKTYAIVFLGAGMGGALRAMISAVFGKNFGDAFPWGLLFINVSGCFVMGVITSWLSTRVNAAWHDDAKLLLTTGMLGGYTTFSSFSLDFAQLWQQNAQSTAVVYLAASVILSLIGVFTGLALGRGFA